MRCIYDGAPVAKSSATELKHVTSVFKWSKTAFVALDRPFVSWSDWFLFLFIEKIGQRYDNVLADVTLE